MGKHHRKHHGKHDKCFGDKFSADLRGCHELPPTPSGAFGELTAVFDGCKLHYKINLHNIRNVTAAHFHFGPLKKIGPVLAAINIDKCIVNKGHGVWGLKGTCDFSKEELLCFLFNQEIYVNVHTEAYPDGEIRGQLFRCGFKSGCKCGSETGGCCCGGPNSVCLARLRKAKKENDCCDENKYYPKKFKCGGDCCGDKCWNKWDFARTSKWGQDDVW